MVFHVQRTGVQLSKLPCQTCEVIHVPVEELHRDKAVEQNRHKLGGNFRLSWQQTGRLATLANAKAYM